MVGGVNAAGFALFQERNVALDPNQVMKQCSHGLQTPKKLNRFVGVFRWSTNPEESEQERCSDGVRFYDGVGYGSSGLWWLGVLTPRGLRCSTSGTWHLIPTRSGSSIQMVFTHQSI